ncbi:MAG: hypothetical protein JXA73_03350, partial [Acidobacteria bacterium]|nr:hypothetical protein [Acidobacteriota bacterium]
MWVAAEEAVPRLPAGNTGAVSKPVMDRAFSPCSLFWFIILGLRPRPGVYTFETGMIMEDPANSREAAAKRSPGL